MSTRALLHTPPPSVTADPQGYWWPTVRGAEIMRAFHAAAESDAWRMIERHPALLMPEVVDAAAQLMGAPSREIAGLREMHAALRGSPLAYAAYHRLLAGVLAHERRGSRRTNLERALATIREVRRLDPSHAAADERTELAIRAALDQMTPLPGTRPPAMHELYLDEGELKGFRRGADRRDQNPNVSDRAFKLHAGLTAGAMEWLGDESASMYRIVDARWVFASTKAAKSYLDSPATQLLARDSLASPAVVQVADGAHAWGGSDPGGRGRQVLLFRVDRVVASLDVSEGPRAAQARQVLSRPQLLPLAEAVARRVRRTLAPYWLAIGQGTVAAQKLLTTPPRKAEQLLAEYPILLLPEFPMAMASLGETYRAAAERLAILQGTSRSNWQAYRDNLRALARLLLEETAGEPRVNADAAQRLIAAHRRLDTDLSWPALEAECAARATEGAGG